MAGVIHTPLRFPSYNLAQPVRENRMNSSGLQDSWRGAVGLRIVGQALALACTAGLVGAAPLVAQGSEPVTRDSAGVKIISSGPRRPMPMTHTLGQPVLDLGGLKSTPEEEFSPSATPLGLIRLSDGRYLTMEMTRLRLFDPTGRQLAIIGRAGSGPDEFRQISSICRTRGDTIVVDDPVNARVTILDGTGRVVREFPEKGWTVPNGGCFDDGTFVMRQAGPTGDGEFRIRLIRVRLDGVSAGPLGVFWGGTLGRYLPIATSVFARGASFYVGDPRSSAIHAYDQRGRLIQVIMTNDPPRVVTAAEAGVIRGAVGTTGSKPPRESAKPEFWPGYRGIVGDGSDRIWLEEFVKPSETLRVWTWFSSDGHVAGRFSLPKSANTADSRIIGFIDGAAVLRREDSDGARHVTLVRLAPIPK